MRKTITLTLLLIGLISSLAFVGPGTDQSDRNPDKPAQSFAELGIDLDQVPPSKLNLGDDLKKLVTDELGDDPAEWTLFRAALEKVSDRLDTRADKELIRAMREAPTAVLREQAIFEYADRHRADATAVLSKLAADETDPRVRIDTLWALSKFGGKDAAPVIKAALADDNPEIREWAGIFHEELGLGDVGFPARQIQRYPDRLFDQSIPLHILCNIYVKMDDGSWVKGVLSPLKIEQVFGKCHANPRVATREHELILTKRMEDYYPDGSAHYETFRFKGLTERTDRMTANFAFIANEERPFFRSGQVGDISAGVLDGDVNFLRVGQWKLDENIPIGDDYAIRYVKGNFMSWGYVAAAQLLDDDNRDGDPVDAGEMMRAVASDAGGYYCNAFVAGTWKGKIADENGDGILDLNYPQSICTLAGLLDQDGNGKADGPGVTTTAYFHREVADPGTRKARSVGTDEGFIATIKGEDDEQ